MSVWTEIWLRVKNLGVKSMGMTQKKAMEILQTGRNVYLTGAAGSGKTYLLNRFVDWLYQKNKAVAITASTGIAATHLSGMTIHSWSGIGIVDEWTESDMTRLLKNQNTTERIKITDILIIDEISMLHGVRLAMVDKICKRVRGVNKPFGGLQVVICGDFFQLPPVTRKDPDDPGFAFLNPIWDELDLSVCYLTEQHRQVDERFMRILNEIRSGEVGEATIEDILSRLNKPIEKPITKLFTHNTDVDALNYKHLEELDQRAKVFHVLRKGPRDLVDGLIKGCLAPEEVVLKIGAVVMFVKNNSGKGFVNGTLGTVIGWDEEGWPVVTTRDGEEIVAGPESWTVDDEQGKPIAEISQIPLRLAWAITVHKSQGMSLDAAVIDLSKSFTFGMGYVALSRVRQLNGIKLLGINNNALMVDPRVTEKDREFRKESLRIEAPDGKI